MITTARVYWNRLFELNSCYSELSVANFGLLSSRFVFGLCKSGLGNTVNRVPGFWHLRHSVTKKKYFEVFSITRSIFRYTVEKFLKNFSTKNAQNRLKRVQKNFRRKKCFPLGPPPGPISGLRKFFEKIFQKKNFFR